MRHKVRRLPDRCTVGLVADSHVEHVLAANSLRRRRASRPQKPPPVATTMPGVRDIRCIQHTLARSQSAKRCSDVPQRRRVHRGLCLPPQALRQARDPQLGGYRQNWCFQGARPLRSRLVLCSRRYAVVMPLLLSSSTQVNSRTRPPHLPEGIFRRWTTEEVHGHC